MKNIKILYVITSLGFGGAERLLLSYVSMLDPKKYKFFVCSLREKPNDLQNQILQYAEITNLKVKNRFNPIVIYSLYKLFRLIEPDIIHTHLFQPRFYATAAHLFYRGSILITHKHNNVTPGKHNVFLIVEMLSILFNKKVIAISEAVKKTLKRYEFVPAKKIFVLHNGIEYQKFYKVADSKSKNEGEIIIGTVCRLEHQKGIVYLLSALKIVLVQYPKVHLEIVGEGSLRQKLEDFSNKLGISNSVTFFGKFTDVIPFYRRMNIFVLPSIYEGFGIVLLEAMAAGIPVIATRVHGIKEVMVDGESGILVPPKNPDAIAEAIIKLIENPQLRNRLIENGFKRSKFFDIGEHINKLDDFYTKLIGV
jgi:glycosyltransferase involved in cell wall biosynthesis